MRSVKRCWTLLKTQTNLVGGLVGLRFLARYQGENKLVLTFLGLLERYFQDELGNAAAAITYYAVFTFFPFLIFISMLLGFLHVPMISLTGEIAAFVPEDVIMLVNVSIAQITQLRSGTLLTVGLGLTIWFAMRTVKALMDAINKAYRGKRPKNPFRHRLLVLLFTLFIMAFIVVAGITLVIGEGVLKWVAMYLPISLTSIELWGKLRFLPLAVILFVLLSALYYVSPSQRPKKQYIYPGALLALCSWMVFSIGFAYYVDNIARYSLIYGSIGVVIVFLMWLYFSMVTILLGAEFNHVCMEIDEIP